MLEDGPTLLINAYDLDSRWNVIRSHAVLYKLHHPLTKYEMELHSAFCAHSLWHACRSATLPGDVNNNTSPAVISQTEKMPVSNHDPTFTVVAVDVLAEVVVVLLVVVVELLVVGMVVAVPVVLGINAIGTNRIAIIARLSDHCLVHGVLKRLQYPFLKKEML